MDDLIQRLEECALCKAQDAWGRSDGGQDLCIGASLAQEAADRIAALEADNARLRQALLPFADAMRDAISTTSSQTPGLLETSAFYHLRGNAFMRAYRVIFHSPNRPLPQPPEADNA
jgi:hypothetical protein